MTETRSGSTATDRVTAKPATTGAGRGARGGRRGPLARASLFYREVVAELRKVLWPTRNELITYTTVVIVFVSLMVAIVAGLDFLFTKGVLQIFG